MSDSFSLWSIPTSGGRRTRIKSWITPIFKPQKPSHKPPTILAPTAKSISVSQGAYTLTGKSVSLSSSASGKTLGINLGSSVSYFDPEQPFLNIIKTGTAWGTDAPGSITALSLDSNGYPTAIPSGGTHVNMLVLNQVLAGQPTGTYVGFYDGTGTVGWGFDATVSNSGTYGSLASGSSVVSSSTKRIVMTVSGAGNGVQILITSTDPGLTGDNIRNMGLVYSPGSTPSIVGANEATLLAGEIFDPRFISLLTPFKRIRFTNWMAINNIPNNPLSSSPFSERALQNWAFWGWDSSQNYSTGAKSGIVPIEVMCALCNKVGADAWFNMPALCSDSYMSSFATLVHSTLNAPHKAYVEFALEVWNFGYTYVYDLYLAYKGAHVPPSWQTVHTYNVGDIVSFANGAYAQCSVAGVSGSTSPNPSGDPFAGPVSDGAGTLAWNSAGPTIGWTVFANRTVHMADAWRTAFGADATTRLVTILGGFSFGFTGTDSNGDGGTGLNEFYLNTTASSYFGTDTWTGNVASHIDAMAIAPYFGGYDNSVCNTLDKVFQEINTGGLGLTPAGAIAQAVSPVTINISNLNSFTAFNGNPPKLIGYECGQGLPGTVNFSLNLTAQTDPRMGTATLQFLNDLKAAGLTDFNYYALVSGWGSSGFWGALTEVYQDPATSSKYQALVSFM